MQRKRLGSRGQRTSIACLVTAVWALAIYTVFTYGLFWLRCIWGLWCIVFWRPPLAAAIVESCLFGERMHPCACRTSPEVLRPELQCFTGLYASTENH
jgi:hypothetical protein